jgi:hypothetical protein
VEDWLRTSAELANPAMNRLRETPLKPTTYPSLALDHPEKMMPWIPETPQRRRKILRVSRLEVNTRFLRRAM